MVSQAVGALGDFGLPFKPAGGAGPEDSEPRFDASQKGDYPVLGVPKRVRVSGGAARYWVPSRLGLYLQGDQVVRSFIALVGPEGRDGAVRASERGGAEFVCEFMPAGDGEDVTRKAEGSNRR